MLCPRLDMQFLVSVPIDECDGVYADVELIANLLVSKP